jgi:quercetin dioxygenase-like cupin family protein
LGGNASTRRRNVDPAPSVRERETRRSVGPTRSASVTTVPQHLNADPARFVCIEPSPTTEVEMQIITVDTDVVTPVVYEWGAVKWVMNDTQAPGSRQSFGVVFIQPGKTNPTHWHTRAQEIVHMLQGECDVTTDTGTIKLRAGQTLFIPAGAHHELTNRGWEPAVYVCSFSASGRGTLFVEPEGVGAQPLAV